jgi:hypothetical protein
MADQLFAPIAQRLLDCWCAQLQTLDAAFRPQRCSFRFDSDEPTMGIALTEDECKCGTAWVRVDDWYVTSDATFPGPDESMEAQVCPRAWALVLEFGIGRCPPTGDQTTLPTVTQLNAFHAVMLEDMRAMRRTLQCCFSNIANPERIAIGDWTKNGPAGKCITQALKITIEVINCYEC